MVLLQATSMFPFVEEICGKDQSGLFSSIESIFMVLVQVLMACHQSPANDRHSQLQRLMFSNIFSISLGGFCNIYCRHAMWHPYKRYYPITQQLNGLQPFAIQQNCSGAVASWQNMQ
eukprot:4241960-Amphidinium_carterae.1